MRFKYFATIFLIIYSIKGALFLAWYFVLYENYNVSLSLLVTVAFEIVLVSYMLYKMFNYGAIINDLSSNHLIRLSEIKSILERLL